MPSGSLVLVFDLDETLWPFVSGHFTLGDVTDLCTRVHLSAVRLVRLLVQAGIQVAVCSRSRRPALCRALLASHGIRTEDLVHLHIERTDSYHKNVHLAPLRSVDHIIMFDDDPRVLQSHAHEPQWFTGVLVNKSTGLLPSQVFDALANYFSSRLSDRTLSTAASHEADEEPPVQQMIKHI